MHTISKKLFPLASFIYRKIDDEIKNGNNSFDFTITKKYISEYYPYSNPQPLNIICGLGVSDGKMEYKNKTLVINIEFFYTDGEYRCISRIIHELTHFINDNEAGGIPVIYREKNKMWEKLSYYLRDTECNARCGEFGYFLSIDKILKPLEEYEDITRLRRIENILSQSNGIVSNKDIRKFKNKYNNYKWKILKIYSSFRNL